MPKWDINDAVDVIGLVVMVALVVGAIAIVLLNRRIYLRKGDKGIEVSEGPESEGVFVERRSETPCVLAHTDTLARLEKDMEDLRSERQTLGKDLRSVYMMIGSILPAIVVLLIHLKGDEINGNVEAALDAVNKAKDIFGDATVGKIGG